VTLTGVKNIMDKRLKMLTKAGDDKLADSVRASAQQIWQAGLGAFVIAEEEGGKVFNRLVREGAELQKRTQKLAEIKVSGVTESVAKIADNVSKQASGSWDKIEHVFEDRVSRTLASLGVPTSNDILMINQRIDELSHVVAALPAKAAIRKSVTKKPAVAPASRAKTASKTVTAKKKAAVKVIDENTPTS
jgi:poly(hydroxyalkanoate) granule-associated protein